MPQTKSVTKALRVSQQKKVHNLRTKRKYKAAVKDIRKAAAKKSVKLALEALPKVYKQLDLAAKKHVIHKNKAARLKSRLAKATMKLTIKGDEEKTSIKKSSKKTVKRPKTKSESSAKRKK
ncbi:30S ribosomal protein S20 [Patescibacteria group bacterium]|nr:30S ribosomal protein S20 [Patescibacteria group bacterium]MBU1868062.1 30S ribosomal protein S20 [Patescibacteria group bacterium]